MNKHDNFWINQATDEDYADPNISTEEQVDYIVDNLVDCVFQGDTILDFGCGYGRLSREIKKAFPNTLVLGMDISPNILSRAMTNNYSELAVYYTQGDKIRDYGAFGAIYSVAVLQHLPDHRKLDFIFNASKALKLGGRVIFQYIEGDTDSFLTHNTSINNIRRWCAEADLKVLEERFDFIQDKWTWVVAESIV